jgi:hypothetical protein
MFHGEVLLDNKRKPLGSLCRRREEKRREEKRREEKRREEKRRQDKTREDKTRQDKTRQVGKKDESRQVGKRREEKTRHQSGEQLLNLNRLRHEGRYVFVFLELLSQSVNVVVWNQIVPLFCTQV